MRPEWPLTPRRLKRTADTWTTFVSCCSALIGCCFWSSWDLIHLLKVDQRFRTFVWSFPTKSFGFHSSDVVKTSNIADSRWYYQYFPCCAVTTGEELESCFVLTRMASYIISHFCDASVECLELEAIIIKMETVKCLERVENTLNVSQEKKRKNDEKKRRFLYTKSKLYLIKTERQKIRTQSRWEEHLCFHAGLIEDHFNSGLFSNTSVIVGFYVFPTVFSRLKEKLHWRLIFSLFSPPCFLQAASLPR